MNSRYILISLSVAAILAAVAYALLMPVNQMTGMDHTTTAPVEQASPSTQAYEVAMARMMKSMMAPATSKPDLDFVQGMIPHHQGAIDMAKIVMAYGKDAEIRKLAEGVIKAQEGEITLMNNWLAATDVASLTTSPESTKANEQAVSKMMKDMMVPYSGNADVDFVKGMIPHHQGAIDAAKVALQYAKDPTVLKLAQEIVAAQESEIAFMSEWLKKNGQ